MKLTFQDYPSRLADTQAAFEKGDPQGLIDLLLVIRPFEESIGSNESLKWLREEGRPAQARNLYDIQAKAQTNKDNAVHDPNGDLQYVRGWLLQHRIGYPLNKMQAAKDWQQAALKGHQLASCKLASCHYKGRGVPENGAIAVHLWEKLAARGHAQSQSTLGDCYLREEWVVTSPEKSFSYFSAAAAEGHATAQYQLGVSYTEGRGTEKDPVKALDWTSKAAEQGVKDAAEHLPEMQQHQQQYLKQIMRTMSAEINSSPRLAPHSAMLTEMLPDILSQHYINPSAPAKVRQLTTTLENILPDYQQRGAIDPQHHGDISGHIARALGKGWARRVEQEMTELPRAASAGAGRR